MVGVSSSGALKPDTVTDSRHAVWMVAMHGAGLGQRLRSHDGEPWLIDGALNPEWVSELFC
jgi:hypothetical protein